MHVKSSAWKQHMDGSKALQHLQMGWGGGGSEMSTSCCKDTGAEVRCASAPGPAALQDLQPHGQAFSMAQRMEHAQSVE